MGLYRNKITRLERTATPDYVAAFPDGQWELLADEAPDEKVARKLREQEEAIRNKVELVTDDDDDGSIELDDEGAPPAIPDELPVAETHGEGE